MGKFKDLTGMRFGRLTVIKQNGRDKYGNVKWLCKCDCGNYCTVIGSSLLRKNRYTKSCGCLRKEGTNDLQGKIFGKLTVIEKTDKRDKGGHVYWICQCECGNTVIINSNDLIKNNTLSCGCLMSEIIKKRWQDEEYREAHTGKNNPNYNPNLTEEDRQDRRLQEGYEEWVYKVKEQANFTCDCCGQWGGKLHSHHLDAYKWNKERRLDITNGVCLCEHCHNEFHSIYGKGNNIEDDYLEYKFYYKMN